MDDGMTTASALESETDRSRFEHLATSVLRKADSKYAAIIHTGVNAQGETIVSPVDGLHLIPYSNPPHYVFVQHTTTDRPRLRGKWLSNDDADLSKAATEAKKVRQALPQSVFTVVLSTNQRLDTPLLYDVYQRAEAENLTVDIWEQSRFADFLDTTTDGHWLRKLFLGIEAERLSADLLHQLGRRSLDLYSQEVLPLGQGPMLQRGLIEDIITQALPGGAGLCLVTGPSGYGKSVATSQALRRWLSEGSLGLWLPARFLLAAEGLEWALDAWLHSLLPSLEPDAGRRAIELATKDRRLLLCIDDINRTAQAARLLRISVALAAPSRRTPGRTEAGVGSSSSADYLCQLIPVWPEQLALLPPKTLEKAWVRTVSVGDLTIDECSGMIREKVPRLSTIEARGYAAQLNFDPFLVGMFLTLADEQMNAPQLASVADDAIGEFLDTRLRELCSTGSADLLPGEILEVLVRVARESIFRRNLRPTWSELEGWFGDGSKELRAIRLLVRQGHVCKLDAEGRMDFRHDRLRDRFLVEAMARLLHVEGSPEDVVIDPYFSAIVGKALARFGVPAGRLSYLRKLAPWVIFEAIREVGEPSSPDHESLFEEARAWATSEGQSATDSVLTAICWTLIETDSSRVQRIIDAFEPNPLLMAAGLRNGSAEHGMRFLRRGLGHDFEPAFGDALRDRVLEQANHRHGMEIAEQLREQLSRPVSSPIDARSYLALLGHFRFAGFDRLIMETWERHHDEVLAYAIWAASRCPLVDVNGVLEPLLARLATLPRRELDEKGPVLRECIIHDLGQVFDKGITPEALDFLLRLGRRDPSLRSDITSMVERVDDPDAIEMLIRDDAERDWPSRRVELTGIGDGDPKTLVRSSQTIDRLRGLWQSPAESDEVQTQAFCRWLQCSECKDIALLKAIGAESPLRRYAIQYRIKLGDSSVAPELLTLLRSDDLGGWWWALARRVWCDELRSHASEVLAGWRDEIPTDFSGGRSDQLLFMAELLVKIPISDSEELLRVHWGHLKFSPYMVHAAFRIGTQICVALAREALSLCPTDVDLFENTFTWIWEEKNPANPITLLHLENLDPYLDRLKRQDILLLARLIERASASDERSVEWIRERLVPRLPPEDKGRVQVADEMLTNHVNRCFNETRFEPYLGYLFDGRSGRPSVSRDRTLKFLEVWLSTHAVTRGLLIAAECLKHIGTRRDLDLLDHYPIVGDAADIERIKADARFSLCRRTLD
jgi:hypothetical protein